MEPLVSIIIPSYNSRAWVCQAIDSALTQTYPRCEIIAVDDGSTDGTGELLVERYANRIKYVYKPNGGLSSARNAGLTYAAGQYIQFLDADDLILPGKVATHVAFLETHPEFGVVYCHSLYFADDKPDQTHDWWGRSLYRSGDVFASMIYTGYILSHMPLARRECIDAVDPFDESLTSCEDWDLWLRVAHAGARFCYLPGQPLSLYRVREDSMSAKHVNHGWNGLRVLDKVVTYVQDPEEQQELGLRRAQGHWRFRYGKALAENGQLRQGLWQMARGILADHRDLDYKLSFMALCLMVGPRWASDVLSQVKNHKDRLQHWVLRSLGVRSGTG